MKKANKCSNNRDVKVNMILRSRSRSPIALSNKAAASSTRIQTFMRKHLVLDVKNSDSDDTDSFEDYNLKRAKGRAACQKKPAKKVV